MRIFPAGVRAFLVPMAVLTVTATTAVAAETATLDFARDGVVMPLLLDNEAEGSLSVIVPDPLLEAAVILRKTEPLLFPEVQSRLRSWVRNGALRLEDLRRVGLTAEYDEEKLEIRLSVPAELRREQKIILRPSPIEDEAEKPAPVSAFLNVFGQKTFTAWPNGGMNGGTIGDAADPLRANLDGAINFGGTVLESQAQLSGSEARAFSRTETRLVHDLRSRATRLSAGDLRYPVTGYQAYRPLGGFSVTREDSITPYDIAFPSSQNEIFLESPSTVDVVVNGIIQRTLRLPAGRFDLREIPVERGLSDIELRIRDEFGRVRIIRQPFIADTDFLRPGRSRFSYALGLSSQPWEGDRLYAAERPVASLFHRLGFTERLTLGANFQSDPDQWLAGLDALVATPAGIFSLEGAASRLGRDDLRGAAARLRYRPLTRMRGYDLPLQLALEVEYRSRLFAPFGTTLPSNPYVALIDLSISAPLHENLHGTIGTSYQAPRAEFAGTPRAPDGHSFSLNLNARISESWNLDATYARRTYLDIQGESRFFVNLVWLEPRTAKSQASLTYDSLSQQTQAQVQANSGRHQTLGTLTSGNSGNNSKLAQADVGYIYNGNAGLAGARQVVTRSTDADSRDIAWRTDLTFASAIAYAGGHIGFSRPISDSFALLTADASIGDRTLVVNPSESSYPGTEVRRGRPGVLPHLSSYNLQNAVIDTSTLEPAGARLERDSFVLLPTYKSGHHLPLKIIASVVARGRLVDEAGHPIALAAGEVTPSPVDGVASDHTGEVLSSLEFFTNRDGRFVIEGLNPGPWQVKLLESGAVITFEVRPGSAGEIDLGDLKPGGHNP